MEVYPLKIRKGDVYRFYFFVIFCIFIPCKLYAISCEDALFRCLEELRQYLSEPGDTSVEEKTVLAELQFGCFILKVNKVETQFTLKFPNLCCFSNIIVRSQTDIY